MGLVRGDPVVLVALFFGAAVLLMGGIYAIAPGAMSEPTPGLIAIMAALVSSLGFCMVVLGRIFWVVGRASSRARTARLYLRK